MTSKRELLPALLVIASVIVAVHGQAIRYPFLWDDIWTLVQNPIACQASELPRLLGATLGQHLVPDAGRPIMLASEMIDCSLWGLRAWGFHLTNLLLHFVICGLLFIVGSALAARTAESNQDGQGAATGSAPVWPLLAAVVFASHPMNVDVVTAVNYREDLLATLFLLLGLGLLLRGRHRAGPARWGHRIAGFLALGAACLSKETGYIAPILLVILDLWPRQPGQRFTAVKTAWRDGGAEWLSALLASGLVFAWRALVMGAAGIVSRTAEVSHLGVGTRVVEGIYGLMVGVVKLVVPMGISPEYNPVPRHWPFNELLLHILAVLALLGLVRAAVATARRWPLPTLALTAGLVAYLPTLGLVPITNLRADRYLYLPNVGFVIALASALALIAGGLLRVATVRRGVVVWCAGALAVAMVAGLGWRARIQSRVWASGENLWAAAILAAPGSARARAGLASWFLEQHESMQAMALARDVIDLTPDQAEGYELMGLILMSQGNVHSACNSLAAAVDRTGPAARAEMLNNLGYCYNRLGDLQRSLPLFEEARALAPWYDRPWLNAAGALEQLDRVDEAVALLDEFLRENRSADVQFQRDKLARTLK